MSNIGSELDAVSIMQLRGLPDQEAADALTGQLVALERAYKRGYIQRGLILLEMEQRELWRLVEDPATGNPYTSMGVWICDCAPYSRADCYSALAAVKELRDVPIDQLLDVPRCNVSVLQALSTQVRQDDGVMQAARTRSQKDFVAMLEKDHPLQHIESRRTIHLSPVKSAKTVIDRAIEMTMCLEDVTTREAAIECWAVAYIEENKERFEQVTGKRTA